MNDSGSDVVYGNVPSAANRRPGGKEGSGKYRKCCGPQWQLDGIFWVALIVGTAILGIIIGIVSKSDDLDQTSRATVRMHDETVELRKNVEAWIHGIRAHFPANQETVTTEQVLDSVDKMHAMMLWANEIRASIPPGVLEAMVKNANLVVGNVTTMIGAVGGMFDGLGGADTGAKERHRALVGNAALFFAKGAELLSTVSPGEFHAAFASGHEALQSMSKLSQNISQDRVNRIIESASDILSSANSTHIVTVIAELVKGANDVLHRFAQPGGIRLSLPLSAPGTETEGKK
jgi:hypothetical protein